MAKELRITFKESESHLYDYIKDKSSPSAFLKDLAKLEKKREDLYLNKNLVSESDISNNVSVIEDIDIDDLDISDLG